MLEIHKFFKITLAVLMLFSVVQFVGTTKTASAASIFSEQELFNKADGKGYGEYRIPSVAVTSNGTVLTVVEARTAGDQTPTDLVLRRSTDGGNTFSANVILSPGKSQGHAEMNPMLLTENTGSKVHLLWSRWSWGNCKFFIMTSNNHGETWDTARDITSVLDPFKDSTNSKYFEGLTGAGMGPSHGFQMTNGVLVVPIYMTTNNWTNSTVSLIYSTDNGVTWNAGQKVPNPAGFTKIHEVTMVPLSDGRLMTNMRNPGSDYRAVAFSNGVNSTWTTPYADTNLLDPINAASLAKYDGSNILFTNTEHASNRVNMTIKVSNNNGSSWFKKRLIYSGATGYSDVAVAPDKTIYVLYEKPQGSKLTLAKFNMDWINEAQVTFNPTTNYKIVNRNSGKLLQVNDSSTVNGANVDQWSDNNTNNQRWNIVDVGNGYFRVTNVNSGKSLDVAGSSTADGANVLQWTYGGGTNQQWSITSLDGGNYQITARHSGKALDVNANSTADGGNVIQWPYSGGANQQWTIAP